MTRSPCCSKVGLRRGPWLSKEDALLRNHIQQHGEGQWRSLPKKAGLQRCGKSCRLRWMNYLRPGIKRGNISEDEEDLIIRLHGLLGNRWSLIAGRLPGRTDNEIKNYWNTYLVKKHATAAAVKPEKQKKAVAEPEPTKKKTKQKKKVEKNEQEQETQQFKVYAPKAIRVTADFRSMDGYDTVSSRTTTSGPFSAAIATVAVEEDSYPPMTWPPLSDLADLPLDDVFLGWDDIPPSCSLNSDLNMLDIVYDEFRQLV